jgi:hypothetical protein
VPIRPSGTGMFETGQSSRMRNLDMSRGQMFNVVSPAFVANYDGHATRT